ncbi:DUF2515 family protein [Burkholderia ubonensis]|uniref:DUF2515 family protein n=1 Tax=Burkholderia ubonensis TaxID=101571 RepID=UPI000F585E3E|nr:hypothetical protein [Burkholderia ubonensis]RQP30064.1 hypothetical protein DF155_23585 [Burkholderia ubonensis]RQP32872.1 hypothetical protein DF154_26770 [Burkholderia ubonensis]RQP35643.1 hypothetical protein DF156_24440 [Burkholderia ubonensis]RQP50310.1 hypothetical protein DF144_23045 [Burkholderia ubonensis]RQP54943.1 hypothetical protein DF151_23885 [Burkholderia ubonensis]
MQKCNDRRCPICYPNWREEEAAAKKRAEDDQRDCVNCWRHFQKQAEAIVSDGDPISINQRINAAYAQLWLDDRRFQWAGLAAFASKQVGCGLLNAADMIARSNRQRDAYQRWKRTSSSLERLSPYGSPRMPVHDQAAGEGARKAYEMLAKGNMALFLDIWPLHMFYKTFGLQRFERCLGERVQLRGTVRWPIGDSVQFAAIKDEIRSGFRAIDANDLNEGVRWLARHEQLNILQPAMYDDPYFAVLMQTNQFAWALNMPTASSREIQLTLANQCTVNGGNAQQEVFSKQPLANLANANQRMAFVMRAARRFDDLLKDPIQRVLVENSLFLIARGGH